MFTVLFWLVIVISICVISIRSHNSKGYITLNEEVEYPSLNDPQFETKARAYFRQQHMMNKFEHL